MSRFENYYRDLIIEKMTKGEIGDALNNPNILVGAEFEAILRDFNLRDEEIAAEYEEALSEWESVREEMERYQKEMWDYHKETEALQKKLRILSIEAASLKRKGDDKSLAKAKILQVDIDKLEKDIEYRNEEGYGEIEPPPTDRDQVELYSDYIEEYMGLDADKELSDTMNGRDPERPVDMSISVAAVFDDEAIKKIFKDFKDAPFKNYKIGREQNDIRQTVGSTVWAIEPDGSLGTSGVEVKSPPMPLPEFMKILPDVFSWINKYADTTDACGLHVHFSIKGVPNLEGVMDPIKAILFIDEGSVWKLFTERVNNQYTRSMTEKLKSGSIPTVSQLAQGFDIRNAFMMLSSYIHDDAINMQHIKKGHIEYRYMGGTNYSKKLAEVTRTIGQFATNISIAIDPNYKKNEYITKLVRIFNKLELLYSKAAISVINMVKQTEDITPSLTKKEKEYQSKVSALSVYKIDPMTMKEIWGNKQYIMTLTDDLKKEFPNESPTLISKAVGEVFKK